MYFPSNAAHGGAAMTDVPRDPTLAAPRSTPEAAEVRNAHPRAWLEPLVRLTDDQFRIPGTQIRFGLDAVLGTLFPVAGDSVTTALACVIVFVAWRDGAPPSLLARMLGNVAIDSLAGAVPLLGDWFDLTFRANRKNYSLLRAYQAERNSGAVPSSVGSTARPQLVKLPAWLPPALVVGFLLLTLVPLCVALLIGYWLWR